MKNKRETTQEKSFAVALAQIAYLLRTEIKLKERKAKVLKSSAASSLLAQTVAQIGRAALKPTLPSKPKSLSRTALKLRNNKD